MNETLFLLMGVGVLFSVICSLAALHFSVVAFIDKKATDKSTHVIEYRDPFKEYPDELSLEKDQNGVPRIVDERDEDMYSEETIDNMNMFIKKNEVIL